jgi:hypothetical protein
MLVLLCELRRACKSRFSNVAMYRFLSTTSACRARTCAERVALPSPNSPAESSSAISLLLPPLIAVETDEPVENGRASPVVVPERMDKEDM